MLTNLRSVEHYSWYMRTDQLKLIISFFLSDTNQAIDLIILKIVLKLQQIPNETLPQGRIQGEEEEGRSLNSTENLCPTFKNVKKAHEQIFDAFLKSPPEKISPRRKTPGCTLVLQS